MSTGRILLDAFNSLTVSGGRSNNDEKEAEIGLRKLSVDSDFSVGNENSPVTLVYDKRMMLHVAPADHPEQPQKLSVFGLPLRKTVL